MGSSFNKRAIFKLNGGRGAILCSSCRVIIKTGTDFSEEEKLAMMGEYELVEQFCSKCQQSKTNN